MPHLFCQLLLKIQQVSAICCKHKEQLNTKFSKLSILVTALSITEYFHLDLDLIELLVGTETFCSVLI